DIFLRQIDLRKTLRSRQKIFLMRGLDKLNECSSGYCCLSAIPTKRSLDASDKLRHVGYL
ncbi:hypothetical protein, partial [Legionella pneumophila]|uniref:hypothetical protein n=1 Tax=Legionella pneumophila TaxID=446 RepID=UPI0019D5463D